MKQRALISSLIMRRIVYTGVMSLILISCERDDIKPQNLDEEVERIALPYIISGERVGIAIGTYDNGFKKFYSYGVKNLDNGGQIDQNTLFEIGSITKTFTTTVLAKLHQRGKISMDDNLQNHFIGKATIPKYGEEQIKLKHLANHTSGLPREPDNLKGDNIETVFWDYSINDFSSFINSYSLPRSIGSESEYSNLGLGILGYALKESQNKTYIQMLDDEIFSPLKMHSTVANLKDAGTSNIAQGYVGNQRKPEWLFSEVFEGAGVLKSNVDDMWKFLEAQLTKNNDSLHKAIQLTHKSTVASDENNNIGLAWVLTTLDDGQEIVWHNGGTIGFNSFIGFNKSTGKGVIILMNSNNNLYSGDLLFGFEMMKALNSFD